MSLNFTATSGFILPRGPNRVSGKYPSNRNGYDDYPLDAIENEVNKSNLGKSLTFGNNSVSGGSNFRMMGDDPHHQETEGVSMKAQTGRMLMSNINSISPRTTNGLNSNANNALNSNMSNMMNNLNNSNGSVSNSVNNNNNNNASNSKDLLGIARRGRIPSRQSGQRKGKKDAYELTPTKGHHGLSQVLTSTGQSISSDFSNLPQIGPSAGSSMNPRRILSSLANGNTGNSGSLGSLSISSTSSMSGSYSMQQQQQQQQQHLHQQQSTANTQSSLSQLSQLSLTQSAQSGAGGGYHSLNLVSHHQSLPSFQESVGFASSTTIRGLKPGNPNWTNQDNYFIVPHLIKDTHTFCILDGHGENGHHVSKRCREVFPMLIAQSGLDMKRAFLQMQNDLNSCEFDVRCSGATCIVATLSNGRLVVSNCGDSRAVLGRKSPGGALTAVPLTNDHKPDKPEERKRILGAGGHLGCRQVLVNQPGRGPVSMPVGPCRVWYQHRGETLGLAMSRSLGDSIVHKSGVSAEPEISEHMVDDLDEFVIIATDGVWDVVDNNQAVQLVHSFVNSNGKSSSTSSSSSSTEWNTLEASAALCKYARGRWEKMSPMIDDITCVIVNLRQ